jgi:hypothetical protein
MAKNLTQSSTEFYFCLTPKFEVTEGNFIAFDSLLHDKNHYD